MNQQLPQYLIISLLFFACAAFGLDNPEVALKDLLSTKLGNKADLSLSFQDSDAQATKLSKYIMPGRPLVIVPVYYDCPRLCGMVMQGVANLINGLDLKLGEDYQVANVSFNPKDTPEKADMRADKFRGMLTRPEPERAYWHFLVGSKENSEALMNQIGFRFREDSGEFAHSPALIILTPQGEISQYFTGVEFSAWDLKLALVEASKGAIGSAIDHASLFCFRFDPLKGRYTWAAVGTMRVGGILTLILLTGLIIRLRMRERAAQAE